MWRFGTDMSARFGTDMSARLKFTVFSLVKVNENLSFQFPVVLSS